MTTTTTSLILPTHQNTTRQATIQILNVTSEIMDLDRDLKIERLELTRLLMKPCCTGTAHWRQETLYANHGIGQTCPMHGDPGQGKRLRIYVSNKSRKQQPVLEAMAARPGVASGN